MGRRLRAGGPSSKENEGQRKLHELVGRGREMTTQEGKCCMYKADGERVCTILIWGPSDVPRGRVALEHGVADLGGHVSQPSGAVGQEEGGALAAGPNVLECVKVLGEHHQLHDLQDPEAEGERTGTGEGEQSGKVVRSWVQRLAL